MAMTWVRQHKRALLSFGLVACAGLGGIGLAQFSEGDAFSFYTRHLDGPKAQSGSVGVPAAPDMLQPSASAGTDPLAGPQFAGTPLITGYDDRVAYRPAALTPAPDDASVADSDDDAWPSEDRPALRSGRRSAARGAPASDPEAAPAQPAEPDDSDDVDASGDTARAPIERRETVVITSGPGER